MNKETETISYEELARRVGDCVMANSLRAELSDNYEFELVNGESECCYKHETKEECEKESDICEYESHDIYQEYVISQNSAEYLQRNTNEIIFYCEKLNIYLWGITHWGTSWSHVFTNINK